LGNTHYLLGSFTQAIKYHQEVSVFGYKKIYILRYRVYGL
jgi:hypothetical protein